MRMPLLSTLFALPAIASRTHPPATLQACATTKPSQAWSLRPGAVWGQNNTVTRHPHWCFDVAGRKRSPGTSLSSWQCCCTDEPYCGSCGNTDENWNQKFIFAAATGQLTDDQQKMGGLCATAAAAKVGALITMEKCTAAESMQQWVYSNAAPHFKLKANDQLCLDLNTPGSPSPPSPKPTPAEPFLPCFRNVSLADLPFCNPALTPKARAADLVSRMTDTEKFTQITNTGGKIPRLGVAKYEYHSEGLHGLRTVCKDIPDLNTTLFPQVVAMAATGNLTLIREMGRVMSDEARAVNNIANGTTFQKGGGLDYWGPTMNIGRDPRWGRFQESVSECPWLNGAYAANFVAGMQGTGDGINYTKIAACCKHFYGYSLESSDGYTRHNFNAVISARDLAETYLVPFRACAAAGVEQVMCSYNAVNGIPTCLDGHAQNEVLRGTFGFDGMIVSDCDAIGDENVKRYVKDAAAATAAGMKAGCDMDCGATYKAGVPGAVLAGSLAAATLDGALVHTFTMRMRLGMFDAPSRVPYADIGKYGPAALDAPASRALALQAAVESITLLRNDAGLLPLHPLQQQPQQLGGSSSSRALIVGVIGPTADDAKILMGGKSDYCPAFRITPLAGIQAHAQRVSADIEVVSAPPALLRSSGMKGLRTSEIEAATAAFAASVDVVVLCLGGKAGGEGSDQKGSTALPEAQLAMAAAALRNNTRTAVVLLHGNPMALDALANVSHMSTLVDALEGGQSAGTALAAVLFGRVSPSGVLPWTVYPASYTSQVAMSDMSMRTKSGIGRTYRFYTGRPTFPFMHGLSYTTFELSWAETPPSQQSVSTMAAGINFVVKVSNTGKMAASKVVAAFVSWKPSSSSSPADGDAGPIKQLFALGKVHVSAGAAASVQLSSNMLPGHCSFCTVDDSGRSEVRPGTFTVTIGDGGAGGASELLSHTITAAAPAPAPVPAPAPGSADRRQPPPSTAAAQLAQTPPRGWRSWIAFQHDTDQAAMHAAIDAIHKPRPLGAGGKLVSLRDLGYSDVGVDGGWARCEGVNGSYHDESGQLLVNETRFPSFAAMTARAHAAGLTASWYLNCDQCPMTNVTPSAATESWYASDAKRAALLGFDGVKFDTQTGGYTPNWNISKWSAALDATGKRMVIEDCLDKHPDGTPIKNKSGWLHPKIDILHDPENCPFSFYRTGGDNFPRFLTGMGHTLIDMLPFLNDTGRAVRASRPGCWAYPDMLAIGKSYFQQKFVDEGCLPLSIVEERTLFATWAILSSPLVLSFDVTNDTEVERLWPVIANERALSINEQWAGEAGNLLKRAQTTFDAPRGGRSCRPSADGGEGVVLSKPKQIFPSWVVWSKRLSDPANGLAVLAINVGNTSQSVDVHYDEFIGAGAAGGGGSAAQLVGTDVWSGAVAARVSSGGVWKEDAMPPHSSRFLVFAPAK